LALADLRGARVSGAALDAVVSRGAAAALPAGWAPDDLVELPSRQPRTARECAGRGLQCLRAEAAEALSRMLAAMRADGVTGAIRSTFRSDDAQCSVFRGWAYDDGRGFCRAATGSALPGHSQHQLGTTADLLTARWVAEGGGLTADFGCSAGGRWLAARAEAFGFVLPYAPPPSSRRAGRACAPWDTGVDPTTGYAYEPWHVRYVGLALAEEFARARRAADGALSLDQWLRRRAGRAEDGDLPVCDGCACGACSTRAALGSPGPCPADESLHVREDGSPVPSPDAPTLRAASASRGPRGFVTVRAVVSVPEGTVTQTPVARRGALRFDATGGVESTREGLARASSPRVRDLPLAYRISIGPDSTEPSDDPRSWPWNAGLARGSAPARFNGAALYLPAPSGLQTLWVEVPDQPPTTGALRVTLSLNGARLAPIRVPIEEKRSSASP
jgi:D-alanyl-D-alanine carboxypeptidase